MEVKFKYMTGSLKKILHVIFNYDDIQQYYIKDMEDAQKKYLEVVSNYINYYHRRACTCKYMYYGLNVLKTFILLIATISGAILKNDMEHTTQITLVLCAPTICLTIETIIGLFHLHEKWTHYRNANNALMKEMRDFAVLEGKYNTENPFQIFVDAVEGIIENEARKWSNKIQKKEKGLNTNQNTEDEQEQSQQKEGD